MTLIEKHTPGAFCWFELATTDQPAAKQFYQSLFGWEPTDSPMGPDEVYTIFKLDGRDVGAAYTMRPEQRGQGVPPNWGTYVAVDSADDAAAATTTFGGTVISPPFEVGEHGRMCVLQDPTGAIFSVWQQNKHAGTNVKDVPHSVSWADLNTRDQARAAAFYSALFGWKMTNGREMKPAPPGHLLPHRQRRGVHRRRSAATAHQPAYPAALDDLCRGRRLRGIDGQGEAARGARVRRVDGDRKRRVDLGVAGSAGRGVRVASGKVALPTSARHRLRCEL